MKKKPAIVATTTTVAALGLGILTGSLLPDHPKQSAEYHALAAKLATTGDDKAKALAQVDSLHGQLDDLTGERDDLAAQIGDLPEREKALKDAQAKLKRRERRVSRREHDVSRREKAVGIVETEIRRNTVHDGTYEVGVDIKAGTYKTDGNPGCYYAVLGSADTNDILNNNLGDGPMVVTVSDGQFLELSCSGAAWVLQR